MNLALRDTFVIARREFLERVKTKWFLVMTILGPIGMIALIVVPALIATHGSAGTRVDIIDPSRVIAQPLAKALTADGMKWIANEVDPNATDDAELAKIRSKDIDGYLRIPADVLAGGKVMYRGDNGANQMVMVAVPQVVTQVVQQVRGERSGLDRAKLEAMLADVPVGVTQTNGETKGSSGGGLFILGYILAFILYISITLYGVGVMRSVVQEKTSRVMEFMVAAVKPRALMAGKIVGVGGAGLVQIGIWLGMGALALAYSDKLLGLFGADPSHAPNLPHFGGDALFVVIAYFVLGYFFYAALYAAAGAVVSSEQDSQQVQMPITMLMVIGFVCFNVVSNAPRGGSTQIMTNVPFWSPMLMPMRYILGGATMGEVLMSLGILAASLLVVVRAAAKIYRVGVLMYGKRPGLRELIRWLRY